MLDFLPAEVVKKISNRSFGMLTEIRIRENSPLVAYYFNGIKEKIVFNDLVFSGKEIENFVFTLCNFSVFSKEESIKSGFITSANGERVGLCGTAVKKGADVVTIKDFSSLCIRIPNDVSGCSLSFIADHIKSPACVLVLSPPYSGKTTFIRDLGRQYSDRFGQNVLFCDERDELSAGGRFSLGRNSDVLKYADKDYCIKFGIRSLNPDVIVCDEIASEKDAEAVVAAGESGVKIIASAHSDTLENILKKQETKEIFKSFIFDYIVTLKEFEVVAVYGKDLKKIC